MIQRCMIVVGVAASLLALDVATHVPSAHAQEVHVTGPLAGQPAVRHMRLYREGRVRLQPFFGVTLQDQFSRTLMIGATASYSFLDWLGVGVWGALGGVADAFNRNTNLTDEIAARGVTTDRNALSLPSKDNFPKQIGHINWGTAIEGKFIPLRGKVSFFQKLFVDTDLFINLGVAIMGVEERASVEDNKCSTAPMPNAGRGNPCIDSQFQRNSRIAVAPSFGAGMSFYFNDFLALSFSWRGVPFKWNTSGTDERGAGPGGQFPDGKINSKDRILHFNQMINVGLGIYFPTEAKISK